MILSVLDQANFQKKLIEEPDFLVEVAKLYGILATVVFDGSSLEAGNISANKEVFSVLCDVGIYNAFESRKRDKCLSDVLNDNKQLVKILRMKNGTAIGNLANVKKEYGLNTNKSSLDNVLAVLNSYNGEATNNIFEDTESDGVGAEDAELESMDTDEPEEKELTDADYEFKSGPAVDKEDESKWQNNTDDIEYNEEEIEKAVRQTKQNEENAANSGDITSLVGDASDEEDDNEELDDVELPDETNEIIAAMLSRLEAIYKNCFELDKPVGMLYDQGMLKYKVKDGCLTYIPGQGRGGKSLFEKLYQVIIDCADYKAVCAKSLKNVPNYNNILNSGFNYYPGFMFKYALGFVNGKKYKTWSSFRPALKKSLENRLKKMLKEDAFFDNMTLIENSFINSILVLKYESGVGMRLRVTFPGYNIDAKKLEQGIRSIPTYNNASITILNPMGLNDAVDISIMQDEEAYLNTPAWAYQAMQVKLANKEVPSLTKGMPIGRLCSGEGFDLKLDDQSFVTMIAAGSGAGKGVLTLSLVAAALGQGMPVYYMDYKPDMASIFWRAEGEFGIKTFAFDGLAPSHKNEGTYCASNSIPSSLKSRLESYGSVLSYLRGIQLMCSMSQYYANHKSKAKPVYFVFDEINAWSNSLKSAVVEISSIYSENKPKKGEQGNEEFKYAEAMLRWIKDVDAGIDKYLNTTGRVSNVFSTFIGQTSSYDLWQSLRLSFKLGDNNCRCDMLGRVLQAGTVRKILGKGQSNSVYGLSGANITSKEAKYIADNRHFATYLGAKCTDGEVTVFKPFLTLNYDDPTENCWTDGLGKMFGAGSVDNKQYIENVRKAHPGKDKFTNKFGVHTGTGLIGLASMYCNGDMDKVKTALAASYNDCNKFFEISGLNQRYNCPEEYMTDLSLEGAITADRMINYKAGGSNKGFNGDGDGSGKGEVNTGFRLEEPEEKENEQEEDNINKGGDFDLDSSGLSGSRDVSDDEDFKQQVELAKLLNDSKKKKNKLDIEKNNFFDGSLEDETPETEQEDIQDYEQKDEIPKNKYGDTKSNKGYQFSRDDMQILKKAVENGDINTVAEIISKSSDETMEKMSGKDGRINKIDVSETEKAAKLTKENSIDCSNIALGPTSWFENMYSKTSKGANTFTNKLFDSMLESVVYEGRVKASLVKRVGLHDSQMFVNDKICNTNGALGGYADLRLSDIVSFRKLFKKFKALAELRLDMEFVEVAMNEFKLYTTQSNKVLERLFKECKSLQAIELKLPDGRLSRVTKAHVYEDKRVNKEIDKVESNRKLDAACNTVSSKNDDDKSWHEKVYGWNAAGNCFANCKSGVKKEKIGRTMFWGTAGVLVGAVGGTIWGVTSAGKKLTGLFRR